MSYTPTDWEIGDVITAEKMNKLEQAVAGAGAGSVAVVKVSASGFGSGSVVYGYIAYASYDGENWQLEVFDDLNATEVVNGFSNNPFKNMHVLPIPSGGTVYPFFIIDNPSAMYISTTGSINSTSETLYFGYGSQVSNGGYRITGNCSIEVILD